MEKFMLGELQCEENLTFCIFTATIFRNYSEIAPVGLIAGLFKLYEIKRIDKHSVNYFPNAPGLVHYS